MGRWQEESCGDPGLCHQLSPLLTLICKFVNGDINEAGGPQRRIESEAQEIVLYFSISLRLVDASVFHHDEQFYTQSLI